MQRFTGEYQRSTIGGESYDTYIPSPLPPNPPLDLDNDIPAWLEKSNHALGQLDGISDLLPDTHLFLYQYVRKEALLSSQIEGTQSSFSDLLLFEMDEVPGVPIDDIEEVSNYIAAMNHGLKRMGEGFPLSLRLLREIHAILLQGGRGSHKQPGEFRRSQNWLGGTRPGNALYVPPPPAQLMECLDPFEHFLNNEQQTIPVLIKAALTHVQFETIHPFLDGNGRLGRLLITLILVNEGLLKSPMLYLSLYFKQNRSTYYNHLQTVRTEGDWEAWILFFLKGIYHTARQAVQTSQKLMELFRNDQDQIKTLGRISGSCLQLHQLLQQKVIVNIAAASKELEINRTTISNCISHLLEKKIVTEITGHRRNRLFVYDAYVKMLSEGAEPLRS